MNIIVPVKQVPDLVEELEVDGSGKDLDREYLKYKINEFDDHALEEALQLKELAGGEVTAIALDSEGIDKTLFTAAAKGADRLVKVTGDFPPGTSTHVAAKALAGAISEMSYDLILTGVQAADDRDGQLPGLLAAYLDLPQVGVVTGVEPDGSNEGKLTVHKEYAGGLMAELEVELPAVLGIQAARETPRYAPVSRVRQMMKKTKIDEIAAKDSDATAGSTVSRVFKPDKGAGAEMLEGSPEAIVDKLVAVLKEKGITA
ncbi:MAG: electron transfer flavoprotein subunit beta/FixA family protein [Acidobacteriota bacterium]|nr:MAG: electron transfer flavoprotein subunit beta/FixA family protein [Acidobacteriota bacterium]